MGNHASVSEGERFARFVFHQSGLSPLGFRRLVEDFSGLAPALAAARLKGAPKGRWIPSDVGILDSLARGSNGQNNDFESLWKDAAARSWRFLTPEEIENSFPGLSGFDRPTGLWVHGQARLEDIRPVAAGIVGSRRASAYGLSAAEAVAKAVVRNGGVIVSGLAFGVDASAHRAALSDDGVTVGIIGTGIDKVYPAPHRHIQQELIPQRGLVVSEFPLGAGPQGYHFPRRNRLIAALSRAVAVIEGRYSSGALITARWAAQLGVDVWALPGSIFSEMTQATHLLLREGAGLLGDPSDFCAALGLAVPEAPKAPSGGERDALKRIILERLSGEPLSLDELMEAANGPFEKVNQALFELEIERKITSGTKGYVLAGGE